MNHRMALKKILNREQSDHLCQFEWGYWPETITRWQQEGLPPDLAPWQALGTTFYHRVPVHVRIFPPFEEKLIEDHGDTQIIQDTDGIIKRVLKGSTAFPQFLKHPVETLRDFEKLTQRLDPHTPDRFPEHWVQTARALADRDSILVMGAVEISFFGWHRDLMGVENLLTAFYDQPDLIHAISRHHVYFLKELYGRIMKDVEFDFIFFWEDMSYKNGPLISPALIREFMIPYYRELIDFFKGIRDYKVLVDSDGDVRQLIPLFLEAGVDGMLPFECAAGMDICRIRREFSRLIMAGGIDKRAIAKGRDAIDKELEGKLPFLFEQGGYLPTLDHHVPPDISFSDFQYYVTRVRELYEKYA